MNNTTTTIEELQRRYKELDCEAAKYNRPEFDKVYSIIDELTAGRDDVGDNGNLALPLATGGVIDEALRLAGFADDTDFVADFKHYREIEQQAREVQLQGLELSMQQLPPEPQQKADGWQFASYAFMAFGKDEQQANEILSFVDTALAKQAASGVGLWGNWVEIPQEDEEEDALLMIEAFGLKCSLVPFLDDLKQYGIVGTGGLLNDTYKRLLLSVVNAIATFAKDNTDSPARIKNHTREMLEAFNELGGVGLVFQILILQGLCRWIEGVGFDSEKTNGYKEAESLLKWFGEALIGYELTFTMRPWGEADRQALQPLCNYLLSTTIGRAVQQQCFGSTTEQPQSPNSGDAEANSFTRGAMYGAARRDSLSQISGETIATAEANPLPAELNTANAKKLLQEAIEAGLINQTTNGYRWNKSKALCAYFADRATEELKISKAITTNEEQAANWKPFEALFNFTNLKDCKAAWRKTGSVPKGSDIVDRLFL